MAEEEVAAGTGAWMAELGWSIPEHLAARGRALEASGHSLVHLAWGEEVRAVFWLDDTARPEARGTIAALRRLGLEVVMLTGDLPEAARQIAGVVGVDSWRATLLPDAKTAILRELQRRHGSVAMVGDGLNDGPVLAAADVGIAVGGATDLARETADLVLPGRLRLLPWAIEVARAARRTIVTSLLWAFGYNVIALGLAAFGLLQPILAAGLMASSSLIVILSSLRLERLPDPAAEIGLATPTPEPTRTLSPLPAPLDA
jgi:Cu2+-exporting ATPase